MTMTNLQQLVAVQAALDVGSVLNCARDETEKGSFVDLIAAMGDDRVCAAFASLVLLVVDVPASLDKYGKPSFRAAVIAEVVAELENAGQLAASLFVARLAENTQR